MTSPAPLTEAERLAAEAIAAVRNENGYGGIEHFDASDWEDEARAVVAAVEPHLTIAALERTVAALEEFAARKHRAGHRRDALGIDEAAEFVLDELRKARQSLPLPASKETSSEEVL